MPNYDYRCQSCDHVFEVFQNMSDPKLEDCPQGSCEGPVKRLLGSGAGVIFKGSGFYQTDYRSESYKKGAQGDKAPAKKSDSSKGGSKGG
jgi:putative FmdB family regulatory protein